MKLLNKKTEWDFLGKRRIAFAVSAVLILISAASLALRGLELGVDFTGGTIIEVGYPKAVDLAPLRQTLTDAGYDGAVVQHFGSARDVMIRLAPREGLNSADLSNQLLALLKKSSGGEVEMRRVEFVGPQVGEELTEDGGLAMLFSLIAIMIYVTLRFEWRFSLGSVAALVHDVIITMGVFSVLGLEFDLSVLAAVLAVIGYSLNDTIVVFDRIRENFRKMRKGTAEHVINVSLNQTLARTLMTSLTTLLVLISLFVFGGEIIHGFATALIVGVVVGTYSSIYVASPITMALGVSRADLMPVKKEGAEAEGQELP
jgi:preprotein translocase subunit SecF